MRARERRKGSALDERDDLHLLLGDEYRTGKLASSLRRLKAYNGEDVMSYMNDVFYQ